MAPDWLRHAEAVGEADPDCADTEGLQGARPAGAARLLYDIIVYCIVSILHHVLYAAI